MNNSEFDRRVREWLELGAERAREAVIWEAIDLVEQTAQRPRWRTRIADAFHRAGPMLRPIAVAAVLLLGIVAIAALSARNVGDPDETPRALSTADLDAILVWEGTKPASWHLDNLVSNPNAVLAIPARSMSEDEWISQPAFRTLSGGRYTDFTGEDAIFMSWGTTFSSLGGARDAFDAIARELGGDQGWGLGTGVTTDLGDEGVVFTGDTTALMGGGPTDPVASRMYLWRVGNAVLSVGGWFDYDEDELERVARAMDARAKEANTAR